MGYSLNTKKSPQNLEEILNNANARSGACLSLDYCLEQIEKLSPSEAIDILKETLTAGNYDIEELQNHIAILWVLHDLGKIQFPRKDYGMALSVQNIAKMEQAELASRLLNFLENNITYSR